MHVERIENPETEKPAEKKRKVTMDINAKVIFKNGDKVEEQIVKRDVFSVMDCVTSKLASTTSKEEMEAIRVSIHSFENADKSDPLEEGDTRWEGPYLVAGSEIEDKSIPDTLTALSALVVPGDHCLASLEQLASQFFLRSRMDGFVVVTTFDGLGYSLPLVNTMKEPKKEYIISMYKALVNTTAAFKKAAIDKFQDLELTEEDFEQDVAINPEKDAEDRAKKIILPSGLPASMAQKGVVTPEQARKDQVKVIGLV